MIAGARIPDWIGRGDEAFLEPPAKGEVAGFPRYGDILVIKKNPEPLWAPVTMETAIGLVVATRTTELEEKSAVLERSRASLADWQDPVKRAGRFAGYEVAAAAQPDRAAFLAEMERVENEVVASIQQELTPEGSQMREYQEVERAIGDASAWLSELAAGERAAPACYVASGGTLRQRLRAAPAGGCVPIVRPNWAFFDRSLPRSAPQVVVIPSVSDCFDDQPAAPSTPAGCPANRQLLSTWDRQAVLDWLK